MKPNVFCFRLTLILLSALAFSACKRTLTAKKMTQSMAHYIYAYTSGTVSREQPVRVRFTAPVAKAEEVGKPVANGLLQLTPSVSGSAVWEDAQTIRFTAAENFVSGQTYVGAIALKKIFSQVPKDAELFEFDFRTRDMYFDVVTDGIQPESGNANAQILTGELVASDRADSKLIEQSLTAQQNNKNLTINWLHAPDGLKHTFRIQGVARTNQPEKVNIAWQGKAVGGNFDGKKEVIIPAVGQFVAMNARLVQDAEQYVRINFSDPLSINQDLKGLVRINDFASDSRLTIDGNSVLLYPTERVVGEKSVFVEAAVKNGQSKNLEAPANFPLSFADIKPQVRLLGRGVILPNSDGLNFPFEAINLNYVDVEIVKIFNNNILQFLQTNDLDGASELERVGTIAVQKRIALKDLNPNATAQRWTRYGLDLKEMIKKDPTAVYQVRIGFRRAYANYNCSGAGAGDDLKGMTVLQQSAFADEEADNAENSWENRTSIMRYEWNGGEENVDYDWQQRDNPCNAQYYNRDHFVSRNIFASDLGIIGKRGGDGSIFVAVSDLKTANPKSGVKLDFYSYQNQIITSATTNSDGVALIKEVQGKPWVVVATSGNQKGYLPLSSNNALNMSRFDVAGTATQKGMKGFLYGERGVWRPGDSLYLNFVLEDKDNRLPDDYPITLELYDPKGALQMRTVSMTNVKNIYPFHIATRPDAPTGTWRADIKAGGATFSEKIKIETVKPNRLKINLDFGKKEIGAGENSVSANLQVNWLHGAPARNAKVKIDATLYAAKTEFTRYKDFIFDNPTKSGKTDPSVFFENSVDNNGSARITGKLPDAQNAGGKMKIGLKIRAFEPGGDFSSDYQTLDYAPFQTYTGISIPKNKDGEKRADINRKNTMSVVVVDKNGNPLRNRSVDVKAYRVEWRWWWESGDDSEADFTSGREMKTILEQKVVTDNNGLANFSVTPNQWGRYLVFAGDPLSGHYAGDFFYAGFPWDDEENSGMSRNNVAMLNFQTNKMQYAVGDLVELNIPTPEAGRALVSIENGSKVLENKWISTTAGVTKYQFKATADMTPTVYAFVTLIQPHNTQRNDLPIRMYGVAPVNVEDPKSRLEPIVKTPDVMKPEEKVTIEVREKSGKPMAYTLAVVDEGLLDLTRFETPNPHKVFFAREALGVQTFDIYDQVLGAYGGKLERILNIGGDKAGKSKNAFSANRFKPVVMHFGPFFLNGGTDKRTITLPNYVGSVRVMAVAAHNGAYGAGEVTTPVRKPLMVLATLPRVLGQKESLKLPVNIFAMDSKIKNATVTVTEKSGLVQIQGQRSKSVTFSNIGDKMVDFDLATTEGVGVAHFDIVAEGGGERASTSVDIDVRNPNPFVTDVKNAVLQAGQSENMDFKTIGAAGTNKVTVEVSSIPPIDLASRLQYLIQYPYGCVEQTTSAAFPQLYVEKLMNLDEKSKNQIANNVKAALERLKLFQTASGGFGYWQGEDYPDTWATNYVGHFLIEAKNAGYVLPPNMLERWVKAAQQTAKTWNPAANTEGGEWREEARDLTQAYRLYTLALANAPESGAMNQLREKKNISTAARWALSSAFAAAGKKDIAKQITNGAPTTPVSYRELSYTFGSDLRDQAMILENLVLTQNNAQALQVAQEVSQKLSSGSWYGTQSVAYGLMAMAKFAGKNGNGGDMNFAYNHNGNGNNFKSKAPLSQIELPISRIDNTFSVKNNGKTPLFVRLILRGQPVVGQANETVIASNLNMSVQYKTPKGTPLDPARIAQGTDFIAEVTLTNPGTMGKNYKEIALAQIFPSGWEILNPRMDRVEGYTNTSVPRYQDIRDDRVNTFFDLPIGKSHTFRVQLNAAYAGKYYLPSQLCEAMYDNTITARQPGRWVEVTSGGGQNPM